MCPLTSCSCLTILKLALQPIAMCLSSWFGLLSLAHFVITFTNLSLLLTLLLSFFKLYFSLFLYLSLSFYLLTKKKKMIKRIEFDSV